MSPSALGLILRESATITRERIFTRDRASYMADMESILALLRSERATGKVVINLSQGAIGTIHFEEQRKL